MIQLEGIEVGLASPRLLLLILPLLLLLLWGRSKSRSKGSVALTGLEYLRSKKKIGGRRRKLLVSSFLALLIVGLGVLWAGPRLHSSTPILTRGPQTTSKNLLIALDVSRSMGGPLEVLSRAERLAAFGKTEKKTGEDQPQTRYEAARETVYDFVERFAGSNIGLILFSTEPFVARWPTTETENRFREVLEESVGRGEVSQLQRFSSLTNTDLALELAREVFVKRRSDGAVIHISDAEDDLENMGTAIRGLRANGIRLYTIGVGISEKIVDRLSREFADDSGFRIFRVDSEEEMREAYRLISELEESPQVLREELAYETDVSWLLAVALVLIGTVGLCFLELSFHHSAVSQTLGEDVRRRSREVRLS